MLMRANVTIPGDESAPIKLCSPICGQELFAIGVIAAIPRPRRISQVHV